MTRFFNDKRRPSTIVRDNLVHKIYNEICQDMGDLSTVVSRQYIYDLVKERTGLCTKTIAYILNHTCVSRE